MSPQITDEMRAELDRQPGRPVRVEDAISNKEYWLVDSEGARHLFDEWLRHELKVGIDQADRGELLDWDSADILAEVERRLKPS